MGDSYDERQANDTTNHMKKMAEAMGHLGSLVPCLAGPLLPFDREPKIPDIITGATLAALAEARTAVNKYWCGAITTAAEGMTGALARLMPMMTPSWKEQLEPSASWQCLIDTCGDALGSTDGAAIMACHGQVKKARTGISKVFSISHANVSGIWF